MHTRRFPCFTLLKEGGVNGGGVYRNDIVRTARQSTAVSSWHTDIARLYSYVENDNYADSTIDIPFHRIALHCIALHCNAMRSIITN